MKKSRQLSQFLSATSGTIFGGVFVTLFVESYLKNIVQNYPWLLVVALIFSVVLYFFAPRLLPDIIYQTKITEARVVNQANQSLENRKVLIALVSKYAKRAGNQSPLSEEEQQLALAQADPTNLDLENSNLAPLITAIKYYPKLEQVWLISTTGDLGQEEEGSLPSARMVEKYIKATGKQVHFHLNIPWIVARPFTPQVAADVMRLVESAVEEAKKMNYTTKEIVTDITGGTVPMSFGAVLACVHPGLDVQYSGLNSVGHKERLEPTVFGFEYQEQKTT